jgi:hypothetical protein
LEQTIEKYNHNLETLLTNKSNTAAIRTRLQGVMNRWKVISSLCANNSTASRTQLIATSNSLLLDMEEVTQLYEQTIHRLLYTEALNKANRQQMLSQRIALDAVAISMDLDAATRREQLSKDITLFSRQLDELKIYANTRATSQAISQVVAQWKLYKQQALATSDDEALNYLVEHSSELLEACQRVVDEITTEQPVTCKVAELLHGAGSQRMLSQRITLCALSYRKGIHKELCQSILKESIQQFKAVATKLKRSSTNTPESYALLDKQTRLIERLERYTNDLENVDLFQILVTSDILLSDTETLTSTYEHLHKYVPQ